jgi:hypothetical protein
MTEGKRGISPRPNGIGLKSPMLWKWLKKVKDVYSWYSFGSGIVKLLILTGIFSGVGTFVVGIPAAIIKGVPWPITLLAGVSIVLAVVCLAATPLIIRLAIEAMRPVSEPINAPQPIQPIRPNWDAWKHVEKFTLRQAACLIENVEPATDPQDPRIDAWVNALCAAIRTEKLEFILNTKELNVYHLQSDWKSTFTRQQRQNPNWQTEITRATLSDFAKRNNIDLKGLG